MKLTFFALYIFAIQINENLAVDPEVPDCKPRKICYGDGETVWECGNGRCINFPDVPYKMCSCPYPPYTPTPPTPKPTECKEGRFCVLGYVNFFQIQTSKNTNFTFLIDKTTCVGVENA